MLVFAISVDGAHSDVGSSVHCHFHVPAWHWCCYSPHKHVGPCLPSLCCWLHVQQLYKRRLREHVNVCSGYVFVDTSLDVDRCCLRCLRIGILQPVTWSSVVPAVLHLPGGNVPSDSGDHNERHCMCGVSRGTVPSLTESNIMHHVQSVRPGHIAKCGADISE